jgi:endonuclease YncB( thermonuclease family)
MRFCLLLLLLAFCSCNSETSTSPGEITGKVVAVSDGDTFTLLLQGSEQEKVRLYGIDCPEKNQPFGQRAKQRLSEMIFGKEVRIDRTDKDRYGRTIAKVWTPEGTLVNEMLLSEGLAWHYDQYDKNEDWEQLEEKAHKKRAGLWSEPNPVAPWEWRKNKREN